MLRFFATFESGCTFAPPSGLLVQGESFQCSRFTQILHLIVKDSLAISILICQICPTRVVWSFFHSPYSPQNISRNLRCLIDDLIATIITIARLTLGVPYKTSRKVFSVQRRFPFNGRFSKVDRKNSVRGTCWSMQSPSIPRSEAEQILKFSKLIMVSRVSLCLFVWQGWQGSMTPRLVKFSDAMSSMQRIWRFFSCRSRTCG